MKNLLIALTLLLTSATVTAATNVKFITTDNSEASDLCVIAAKEGFKAAQKKSDKYIFDTKCNGQNIRAFAKSFQTETKVTENVSSKEFLVKPANSDKASQVCAQAAKTGIKSVIGTVDFNLHALKCNGESIFKFAKKYSNI